MAGLSDLRERDERRVSPAARGSYSGGDGWNGGFRWFSNERMMEENPATW